ncbi:hypothetical protein [Antarctobacter sp.]|uniref:hypothetical protein n=1 Tax=Antarctobacter sp. TaxID=1872577 RepID=UPI002B270358|nr:hypothetical protein [Antarctobacter sp.]
MSALATSAVIAVLAALAGLLVGLLHFWSLRLVADRLVAGQMSAVVLQMARLVGLALFLYLCTWFGALALLGAGVGVMCGRAVVLRRKNAGTP